MLTTREAATILNVTPRRVTKLIAAGRLLAMKVGRDWLLTPAAIAAYEPHPNGRRGGRPRKVATTEYDWQYPEGNPYLLTGIELDRAIRRARTA